MHWSSAWPVYENAVSGKVCPAKVYYPLNLSIKGFLALTDAIQFLLEGL